MQITDKISDMAKIIDLSVGLAHHMPRYPSAYLPEVTVEPAASHEKEARSAQILSFGSHVSTHLDAPFHALPEGKSLDQLPLSQLIGTASMIRLDANHNRSNPIDESDFQNISNRDSVEKLVIDTGWARDTWGTEEYFTQGPWLTRSAARCLAAMPRLHLLGMDFPNVDSAEDTKMGTPAPNHNILLGSNILLLENLINLEKVSDEFFLFGAPVAVKGGDGFPVRAVALSQ